MVREWEQAMEDIVIPVLPSIVSAADRKRPQLANNIDARLDQFPEDIESVMRLYANNAEKSVATINPTIVDTGNTVERFNAEQWAKITNAALGVPLFQNEPWLADSLSSFIQENTALITKLSEEVRFNIQSVINRGVRQGLRHETIAKELRKTIFRNAKNRAKLIARDQVNKWNGQLTQLRQTEVGIAEYFWRTSKDERVRPSHKAMDGKLCRWDNQSLYKNSPEDKKWLQRSSIGGVELHPGQDINCRCTSSPNFTSVQGLTRGVDG
jgi:SPP1 gp7 family putative phage head morphogenesis protein